MEIKSALWQKLFILPISLLIWGGGAACSLSPFVPAMRTNPQGIVRPASTSDLILAPLMGLFLFAMGFALWWATFKYSIRADEDGVTQTNGFFQQSVRWEDVAAYYMTTNPRHHKERRLHIEPMMLDANGAKVFQGFAHLLISTESILRKRRELWQYVEARLEGKRIEPPPPILTSQDLAIRSLNVDWTQKSRGWKIGYFAALVLYALLCISLMFGPLFYYLMVKGVEPPHWIIFPTMLMMFGPLFAHLLWVQWKRRQIEKEMKRNNG
jgi:hypothetical protein